MTRPDDLIAKAEAVIRLWDLVLFTTGNSDGRNKRADVLHQAILNLKEAAAKAREGAG